MKQKTPPPWECWAQTLQVVEETLLDIDDVYRDDPDLPEYQDFLDRKRQEFRARIRSLVERN
ncbi:MAG TPA: hypothetical protein VH575_12495 [Gemmataceae bacterium]|jgi:hypothetical protein